MTTDGRTATGTLLVRGEVDGGDLATTLGGAPARLWTLPTTAVRVGAKVAVAVAGVGAAVALRSLRALRRGKS